MTLKTLRAYCLSKPGTSEEYPFGPEPPVYKVSGRMFALFSTKEAPVRLTLKLHPLNGQMARDMYRAVHPGYHMNKEHWNTIELDGTVPEHELQAWIDESYDLVVAKLPRALRGKL